MYHHNTGYPGGLRTISFEKLIDKAPERTIQSAVGVCCQKAHSAVQYLKN